MSLTIKKQWKNPAQKNIWYPLAWRLNGQIFLLFETTESKITHVSLVSCRLIFYYNNPLSISFRTKKCLKSLKMNIQNDWNSSSSTSWLQLQPVTYKYNMNYFRLSDFNLKRILVICILILHDYFKNLPKRLALILTKWWTRSLKLSLLGRFGCIEIGAFGVTKSLRYETVITPR